METILCMMVACLMSLPFVAASDAAAQYSDHPVTAEAEAARLKRISDEVHRRRALREAQGGTMQGTKNMMVSELVKTGGVFGPEGESGFRPAAGVSLNLASVPLVTVARLYAKLLNREVMVSSKVAARRISLELTEVPQDEAARAIQAAMATARVRQVELNDTTVAWVDAR